MTTSSEIDIVVRVGHAEYMLDLDEMAMTIVWDPDTEIPSLGRACGEFITNDNDEAVWAIMTGLSADLIPDDADLCWEKVVRIHTTRATLRTATVNLAAELTTVPTGDDTVFDYWPSGVRLARQIAMMLDEVAVTEAVEFAVQTALAGLSPETRDELLTSSAIEVNMLVPAYWLAVKSYVGEAEHQGEIPTNLDEFIVDLRAWIENQ